MALALANSNGGAGTTTVTVTMPAATAGNFLVAVYGQSGTGLPFIGVSFPPSLATGTNNWDLANLASGIYWGIAAGGETTYTATAPSGVVVQLEVMEFSGWGTGTPVVDVSSSTSDQTGTSLTGLATGTLGGTNDICIGYGVTSGSVSAEAWSNGFNSVNHSTNQLLTSYKFPGVTTAQSTTPSWTTSRTAFGNLIAFRLTQPVVQTFTGKLNVIGSVVQTFTGKLNVIGSVVRTFTGLLNVKGRVGPFKPRTEAAWTTDPLTRPSTWTDLASVTDGVRNLNVKRGTKVRSFSLDTGTASVVADNAGRVLDPTNTASLLYPNVQPRKRLRDVVTVAGTDVVLHTGFLERITIDWAQKTGSATLPTQDLFGLLANAVLPPSVLDIVTRSLGPVAYWPMSEANGVQADDIIGDLDGEYAQPVNTFGELVPFDPRKAPKFGRPTLSSSGSNNMTVYPFVANPAVSAAIWFKWDIQSLVPTLLRRETVFMLQDSTSPVTFSGSSGIKSVFFFPGLNDSTGEQKVSLVIRDGSGFNQIDSPVSPWTLNIYDGQPHQLAFSIDGATKTRIVWVDGVRQTMHDNPDGSVSPISSINVAGVLSAVRLAAAGWGIQWNTASQYADTAAVGNVPYFDRMLTDAEVLAMYVAGTNPWDGDTTGARANRILDLIGVDPLDRDIDTGTQVCGATILNNQNGLGYFRKINDTESGVAFVSGDGKITLRARNDSPVTQQIFSDRPDIDGGVPIAAVKPTLGLDRIINTLTVGRENAADQVLTNPTSVTKYGTCVGGTGGKIDTLHQTAADARVTGQRLVDKYGDPMMFISAVTISATDRLVSADAMLREIGDAVEVFQRPAGGGAAIHLYALIEAIEHSFPSSLEWYVTYSLVEYIP